MIFVADSYNHTIRRVTPGGEVSTVAGLAGTNGSSDGTGATARFSYPAGLQVDGSGNIYVADHSNYTIRKITPGGAVSTFAGSARNYGNNDGVGSAATFATVSGLAFDGIGNLYVADEGNSRIRKITPGAAVTTLAGGGSAPGSEDGTGAAARFRYPSGIAATAAGELYVADTDNLTVRYIDTAAAVTTLAGRGERRSRRWDRRGGALPQYLQRGRGRGRRRQQLRRRYGQSHDSEDYPCGIDERAGWFAWRVRHP